MINIDLERVTDFVSELATFDDLMRSGSAAVIAAWNDLSSEWRDDVAARVGAELEEALTSITRDLARLEEITQGVRAVVQRYAMLASSATPSVVRRVPPGTGGAGSPTERAHGEAVGALAFGGFTLIDTRRCRLADFDWGVDDPHAEFRKPHHGRSPDEYREFVRALEPRLRRFSAAATEVERDAALADIDSAWLGHDAIRLERKRDGRFDVIDGRHRLYWALREGLTVAVRIVERSED